MNVLLVIDSAQSQHDVQMLRELESCLLELNVGSVYCEMVQLGRPGLCGIMFDDYAELAIKVVVLVATAHKQAPIPDLPAAEARKVMDRIVFGSLNLLRYVSDDQMVVLAMPSQTGPDSEEVAWHLAYGAAKELEVACPSFKLLTDKDNATMLLAEDWAKEIHHLWRSF